MSVCTKGCVIYLPNVRVPDNATPVSRLEVIVAMVTLANRCHRSGLFFPCLYERKRQKNRELYNFFLSFLPLEWWILIKNRTHVA